jgi:phosphosulfolactate synthase
MVMDKGLSVREAENLADSAADYIDFLKLGFGTALVSKRLQEKIDAYQSAGIKVYFGGTMFELFIVRGLFDDYRRLIDKYKVDLVEVSDGSMEMNHDEKCEYIRILSKDKMVISEVGSKQAGVVIPDEQWASMMNTELQAGSFKVIAEAREAGNIGIYKSDGSLEKRLIDTIMHNVPVDNVIWETPTKPQQVAFVKMFGANVSLGNIAPTEVISLETIRRGLRGDTFFHFLP